MRVICISTFFILFQVVGYGQGHLTLPIKYKNTGTAKTYDIEEYDGSPYLKEDFSFCKLYNEDKEIGDFYYRYNVYENQIEIKAKNLKKDEPAALLKHESIYLITEDGAKIFLTKFINSKKEHITGYLTLLYEGNKFSLLRRNRVKYRKGEPARNSFIKEIKSAFVASKEYYTISKMDKNIVEIPLKKKDLYMLVNNEKRSELKSFFKINRIDLKNEKDLKEVMKFIDNL